MIRFKQKDFTLQEGHYTGPKDMEKVPGTAEMIGKAMLGGSAVGAVAGGVLKETKVLEETGIWDGAKRGGKIGFLSGIALKMLTNYMHKPMKKVKFQEVDKLIRREFGMYRVSGITIGDSREKRKTFDEKFRINDRKVTNYKINFCIQDNNVTMYTLNLTTDELEKINNSIDYYCKKYSGMEYSSRPINARTNTYSVNITFTNYEAIATFILELSEELGCAINIMDNKVLAETNIGREGRETEDEVEERIYSSLPTFSKYDLTQILMKSGAKAITMLSLHGPKVGLASLIDSTIKEGLKKMRDKELALLSPLGTARSNYDNNYLEKKLQKLGYIEGMHYTVGDDTAEMNISLLKGIVIITANANTKSSMILDKIVPQNYKRTDVSNKVIVWTGTFDTRAEFDVLLKKIVNSLKPNIFIQ